MSYIDCYLAPVPRRNRAAYEELARLSALVVQEHGAIRVVEAWLDDRGPDASTYHGEGTQQKTAQYGSFVAAGGARDGETVVMSWVEWPDKATRDAGMAKVTSDPRMQFEGQSPVFEGSRLIAAGFLPMLDSTSPMQASSQPERTSLTGGHASSNTSPKLLRLFDWAPSPFCMKIRSILNYKGVQYERVAVHGPSLMELFRRSSVRKVPALDVDGRMLIDSTDIAHEIELMFPEPSIVPSDPRLQGLSHALEDWSDESLYFLGLYFQWIEPRGKPMVRKAFGATPLGIAARLFYQRRIEAQLRGQGTGRKSPRHIVDDLKREFTSLSAMIAERPFLLGDKPYLCDFAVNAQLVYLSRPPASAEILREYSVLGAYMERMKALRPASSLQPRNDHRA